MIRALVVVQWVLAGFVCVSALVVAARRRPQFPWMELGLGLVAVTNLATALPSLVDDSVEPAAWIVTAAMAAWLLVLFTFPDGRPAPDWTRWVLVSIVLVAGLSLLFPFGDSVRTVGFVTAFAVGVAAQVWRFRRRSSVTERQATKWLLAGLIPSAAAFIGVGLIASTTSLNPAVLDQRWYLAVSVTAIWLVPMAASVGLLVADRAPIDGLLHAVIVVFGLAVAIGWLYFAILPVVGPTWGAAVAVVLVLPVRSLLDRFATYIVYAKGHASPVVLLEQRLVASVPDQDVAAVVAGTVSDALSVPYVAVKLHGGVAAEVGDRSVFERGQHALEVFPVHYLGSEVAEIVVAPRTGDSTLAGRDREVLVRLADSAGAALHGAAALRDLSLARERLVFSREEERRRLRRDLHDDLAPTLAGLGMRAAAATAQGSADRDKAKLLYDEVQAGIHAAIAQVREIAYDLRPPMLDDLGLEAAIRDRLGADFDPDLEVEIEVRDLPPTLPAAVELAALRIVQEAVTNVRRHADARSCRVTLSCESGHLEVLIEDDGRGISPGHLRGVGLRSLEERALELGGQSHIGSLTGGGTRVTVLLPIREGAEQ